MQERLGKIYLVHIVILIMGQTRDISGHAQLCVDNKKTCWCGELGRLFTHLTTGICR